MRFSERHAMVSVGAALLQNAARPQDMTLFIHITQASTFKEGSWLLDLKCKWHDHLFHHEREWPVTFSMPLTRDDMELLRWYLDEFSSKSPFQLEKAKDAAHRIVIVGRVATKLIRDILALRRPLQRASQIVLNLCFLPTDRVLAELPWEALENYEYWHRAVYPGASICVVRSVAGREDLLNQSQAIQSSIAIKNILLISSRSKDARDILPDLLTLPIVGHTESIPVAQRPQLHFARPATWDHILDMLKEHGPDYFDVVHFDVHGAYVTGIENQRTMCLQLSAPAARGKGHFVSCQAIAKALGAAKVKLVVANACQSASMKEGWENNFAAALVDQGVLYAVAMSYKISADGAKIFTQVMYSELLSGKDIWHAALLARAYMRSNSERHARFGRLVNLQDWIVPVMYTSSRLDLSKVISTQKPQPWWVGKLKMVEPGEEYPYGRAFDVSRIEDLIFSKTPSDDRCRVLLLTGTGGIGKSHFLKYLSWWWEISQAFSRIIYLDIAERTWNENDPKVLLKSVLDSTSQPDCDDTRANLHTKENTEDITALSLKRNSNGKSARAIILDNMDAVVVQNKKAGRESWDSERRNILFEKLQESVAPQDVVFLCSRRPIPWSGVQSLGMILKYDLSPPADQSIVTRTLETFGVLWQYEEPEEAIAIQNIVELMSHHPTALLAATQLMAEHHFTARRTFQLLHEMTFMFSEQPAPPDLKGFYMPPNTRLVEDLEEAFNSAKDDPMLISFLAITGCCRQLLPPDLVEIEDILQELSCSLEWVHEFRRPSLRTFLLWSESWGLVDLTNKTEMGYTYLNPLIWFSLQFIFMRVSGNITVAKAKLIGYIAFVRFTMRRLSAGRLDSIAELSADSHERTSEIISITVALACQTPADATDERLFEPFAFDTTIISTMRLIRTFKVMLGPRLNPPHCTYFSALYAFETLSSRFSERNDPAQLEAIEGICMLFIQNDWAAFDKWTSLGLQRVAALKPDHGSEPSWFYFDFTFRYFSNAIALTQASRGFTRNCNPRPLNAQLVELETEPYAPIPRTSEYYTPYHVSRLSTHIKAFIGANISSTPIQMVNTIRSRIVESCDILLGDVTAAGNLRQNAVRIRKFFAKKFDTVPDMKQVYSLVSCISPISPTMMNLLREAGTADLGLERTYGQVVQALEAQEGVDGAISAKLLHMFGAMSAWHRDDLDGAIEHLRAAERQISPNDMAMKMNLWYLYSKVYAKMVAALPMGSSERQEMKKKLCEALAQILRMIEINSGLEELVKDDEALLDMSRRWRMIFDDDGVRKEFGILEWWHWREEKQQQLHDLSFD
ncbi:Fc.00g116470.m01.CDS01, partial [Cosmosporella sp. VM-42]